MILIRRSWCAMQSRLRALRANWRISGSRFHTVPMETVTSRNPRMSHAIERDATMVMSLATEIVAGGPPCFCCNADTNRNYICTLVKGITPMIAAAIALFVLLLAAAAGVIDHWAHNSDNH